MTNNEPTLVVRNAAQKILWDDELTGQISDGRWENSRPHEHYVCRATREMQAEWAAEREAKAAAAAAGAAGVTA